MNHVLFFFQIIFIVIAIMDMDVDHYTNVINHVLTCIFLCYFFSNKKVPFFNNK